MGSELGMQLVGKPVEAVAEVAAVLAMVSPQDVALLLLIVRWTRLA